LEEPEVKTNSVRAALLAAGAAVSLSSAQAAVFTATWTGAAGNSNYSDPGNWNIPGNAGAVPIDDATDQFNVVIPASVSVELDIATPNTIAVQDFTIGAGARLIVRPGRAYSVLDDAQIAGIIDADGASSFTASGPGVAITGTAARFEATGNALITVNGATHNIQNQGNNATIYNADGADTILNLSGITAYNWLGDFGGAQTHRISASNVAEINLSGLRTISMNVEAQDRLIISQTAGGSIDLTNLNTISGAGEVRFATDAASFTLPGLINASNISFEMNAGSSLELPALLTQDGGRYDVPANGYVDLISITSLRNAAITIGVDGQFFAGNLADFNGSSLTLGAGQFIGIGSPLASIDDARFFLSGGATFSVADDAYTTDFQYGGSQNQFTADGAGTDLDLSSLTSYTINNSFGGIQSQIISATNGGLIDLSGLTTITANVESQDRLEIRSSSGGVVDLSNLQSVLGDGEVRFVSDAASYTLPALANANNVSYSLQPGSTLNLPALTAQTGGQLVVPAGGTFNLPALTTLTNAFVGLTSGTFNAPVLANIDNTQIEVSAGGSFTTVDDVYNTNLQFGGTKVQLSADGTGSALNLASITAYNANASFGGIQAQQIRATNNGHIDLSGLTSIAVNAEAQDRLEFFAASGGSIDLTALQSITGITPTRFTASGGGTINLGDLTVGQNVQFVVSDVTSTIDFAGSLLMTGGTASFAAASTLAIGNHFAHRLTDETAFAASTADLLMAPPSGARNSTEQFLEVAGLDLGAVNPGNNGNFGFGRLIVGEDGGPATRVTLLDVIDNGNRGGGGEPEALYLFGLGGPEGLVINGGSTLLINNINVYFFDDGAWVHLNSLFGPDEFVIPFDNGFVEIPAPGALAMLSIASLAAARRRRPR
jgi:hypothetical protein